MALVLEVIGDTHGKDFGFASPYGIVIGDLGFKRSTDFFKSWRRKHHYLLLGNHDWYPELYEPHSLWDLALINTGNHKIACIRGAMSIDTAHRTEGVSWFRNEELEYRQQLNALKVLEVFMPDIILSHDCPQLLVTYEASSTRRFLEEVFSVVRPDIWLYGHHHVSKTEEYEECIFQCLAELERTTINIDRWELIRLKL